MLIFEMATGDPPFKVRPGPHGRDLELKSIEAIPVVSGLNVSTYTLGTYSARVPGFIKEFDIRGVYDGLLIIA